MSKHLVIYL